MPEPADIPARAGTCSFCARHGGVWTSCPGGSLKVAVEDPARVSEYAFDTKTACFHVCTTCGVVPFVTSEIDERLYAVVNVNAFEGVDPAFLRRASVSLDEESEAVHLARRRHYWIARVEYM
jgi:hypothetical protein